MTQLDTATQQAVAATPTGMAPAADAEIFVTQPGHQTPLDAVDPFARVNEGWVSSSDDPIANREWRYEFGEEVKAFINTGVVL
jgi:hypothetical protein